MKTIFTNLALFTLLAFAVSSFSACSGSGSAEKASSDSIPAANSGEIANKEATKKSSEYPPLSSGIAQADIELLDGTLVKIADRKGKVLLLNLWATWCGPCREEMPHLVAMQNEHRNKGFEIVGLNIGDEGEPEPVDKINTFAEKMMLNYELARISNETSNEFNNVSGAGVVPQSFLVDREGNLRGVFIGGGGKVINTMKETVAKVVNE